MYKSGQKVWVKVKGIWRKAIIRGLLPENWYVDNSPPLPNITYYLLDLDEPGMNMTYAPGTTAWAEKQEDLCPRDDDDHDQFGSVTPNQKSTWSLCPWHPADVQT